MGSGVILDLYATLAEGKLRKMPTEQEQKRADAASAARDAQVRVAVGRKDKAALERILAKIDASDPLDLMGIARSEEADAVAELVKDAVCFDVTPIVKLMEQGECEFPDTLPEIRIPHRPTLFVASVEPYRVVDTYLWWIMDEDDRGVYMASTGLFTHREGGVALYGTFGITDDPEETGRGKVDAWRDFVMRVTTLLSGCRNVGTVTAKPPRPWRRARERAGLPVFNSYHILQLFGRQNRGTASTGEGGGTPKRLHSVRGHFKHTRHGTFWWHPHWRGRPDRGVVVKDYMIAPTAPLAEIVAAP